MHRRREVFDRDQICRGQVLTGLSHYNRVNFYLDNFHRHCCHRVDFKLKVVNMSGKRVRLQIWDTAGQEKYRTINAGIFYERETRLAYYKSVMGVVLMYSISDKKSFENVSFWIKSLDDNCKSGISKILVGNKLDLEDTRQVQTADGKTLAEKHGMMFFETSAKTGINVENVFMDIARDIMLKNPGIITEGLGKTLNATTQGKEKTKGECC